MGSKLAVPEGFSRALSHQPYTLRSSGTHTRGAIDRPGVALERGRSRRARPGAKCAVAADRWCYALAHSPQIFPTQFLFFRPKYLEA
jgi:hypothetical protein